MLRHLPHLPTHLCCWVSKCKTADGSKAGRCRSQTPLVLLSPVFMLLPRDFFDGVDDEAYGLSSSACLDDLTIGHELGHVRKPRWTRCCTEGRCMSQWSGQIWEGLSAKSCAEPGCARVHTTSTESDMFELPSFLFALRAFHPCPYVAFRTEHGLRS